MTELTEIRDLLTQILATQAVHTEQLREHMRRTDVAETALATLRGELQPVKLHVARVDGALKLLGALATGLGVLAGLWTAWSSLHG